jgi:hypothetical protein
LIAWDKFLKLAEILSVVEDCQEGEGMIPGPPVASFRSLIWDTPILMNEEVSKFPCSVLLVAIPDLFLEPNCGMTILYHRTRSISEQEC